MIPGTPASISRRCLTARWHGRNPANNRRRHTGRGTSPTSGQEPLTSGYTYFTERTATILQPGQYKLERIGQVVTCNFT
jgi:hypothetical protein